MCIIVFMLSIMTCDFIFVLNTNTFSCNTLADDCFSCLPPYAGWLTSTEKANYDSFVQALRQGYVQLQSVGDDRVTQWVRRERVYLYREGGHLLLDLLSLCIFSFSFAQQTHHIPTTTY